LINANSGTVAEKPSFRSAAAKRRALVPADGYYEWQKNEDGMKTPHYLHGEDADDKWFVTATIITRAAHEALGHIHDRTPVIIPNDLQDQWLDPTMTRGTRCSTSSTLSPNPTSFRASSAKTSDQSGYRTSLGRADRLMNTRQGVTSA